MRKLKAAHTILLLFPLYTVFMTFSRGFYHEASFFVLIFAFLLFSIQIFKRKFTAENKPESEIRTNLFFILIFYVTSSLFFVKGYYQAKDNFYYLNLFLLIISAIIISTYHLNHTSKALVKYRFWILISLNILIRLFLLIASPSPKIDVFDAQKLGAEAILQLKNPYNYQYSQVYANTPALTYYPYPPGSLLLLTPVVYLFKDPRILFVITEILTALMLFGIIKKFSHTVSELIPIVYLFFPISYFILEQSWLDPLASFFIVLFAYLNRGDQKSRSISTLALGILITIKQYLLIFPLFLLREKGNSTKNLIIGCLFAFAITLFFFLVNPEKFNVYRLGYNYRFDSLTLVSFVFHNFNYTIPKQFIFAIWGGLLILVNTRKKSLESFEVYLNLSYWLLSFFLVSFIAFVNEYYLSYSTLILAYALSFKNFSSKRVRETSP